MSLGMYLGTSAFSAKTPGSTGFGTPTFGSQTPAGSLFGTGTGTSGGLFGSTGNTFGQMSSSGFGFGSNTPSAAGTLFSSTSNAGSTGLFSTPVTTSSFGGFAFAASSSGGFFSTSSSLFGSGTGSSSTMWTGTAVKFKPVISTDTMVLRGVSTNVNTRHQVITAMSEYNSKSLEELRLEDYAAKRGCQPASRFATGASGKYGMGISGVFGSMHFTAFKFRPILSTNFMMSYGVSTQVDASHRVMEAPNECKTSKIESETSSGTLMEIEDSTSSRTRHQVITAMKEFESKSFEELRMEDYAVLKSMYGSAVISSGQTSSGKAPFPSALNVFNCFGGKVPDSFIAKTETAAGSHPIPVSERRSYQCTSCCINQEKYSLDAANVNPSSLPLSQDRCSASFAGEAEDDVLKQLQQRKQQLETAVEVHHLKDQIQALEAKLDELSTTNRKQANTNSVIHSMYPLLNNMGRKTEEQMGATANPVTTLDSDSEDDTSTPTLPSADSEMLKLSGSLVSSSKERVLQSSRSSRSGPGDYHFVPISVHSSFQASKHKSPLSSHAQMQEDFGYPITTPSLKFRPPSDLSSIASDLDHSSTTGVLYDNEDQNDTPPHPGGVVLRRAGYYTVPSVEELAEMVQDDGDEKFLYADDLTIGRVGYGSVFFPGKTNLAGMNLDEIVHIRRKEITIYPDSTQKPAIGDGLNKQAKITLNCVWPTDKTSRMPIKDVKRLTAMKYGDRLKRATVSLGAKFLDYRPESGTWIFEVLHFSKYGLSNSDEEDEVLCN